MFAKGKNIQQFHSVFSSILMSGRWGCVGYVLVLRGRVNGVVVLRRWGWGLVFWGCLVGVRRGHWSRIHWLSSTIGKPACCKRNIYIIVCIEFIITLNYIIISLDNLTSV